MTEAGDEEQDGAEQIMGGTVSPFGSEKSSVSSKKEPPEYDVDTMLANLEIPDFTMSLDLSDREKVEEKQQQQQQKQQGGGEEDPLGDRPWEGVDWKDRLGREEVFSKRYKPKRVELNELKEMASLLGVNSSATFLSVIGMRNAMEENIHNLLSGDHSILLSILPAICDNKECELLILTGGFILKYRSNRGLNPLKAGYEACHTWEEVGFIERANPFEISLHLGTSTKKYDFSASEGGPSLNDMFQRLEHVVVTHEMFHSKSDITDIYGWQHLRIRKPVFSAVIMNDLEMLNGKHQAVSRSVNELDSYNHQAPLHYAILKDEPDVSIVRALLNAGADPNLKDGEGRSAMYYAERHEVPGEILEALNIGGGKKSKLAETELRGELFGRVECSNINVEHRRERERVIKDQKAAAAQAKAEGAQAEMSKAIMALRERGEKIEQLDQKTKDLEAEAKTYGDLAARLKNEVKGKKWYQL